MKYPKIKYVEPLKNHKLFLIFENGIMKIYSIKDWLEKPAFKALTNIALFNTVEVDPAGYGIIWNDELDLSEFELWKNGVEVSSIEKLTLKVAV